MDMKQYFTIKADRLPELKSFIKEHLKSARFIGNPIFIGSNCRVSMSMDVNDGNKLSELQEKWHNEDNHVITKQSFLNKTMDFLFDLFYGSKTNSRSAGDHSF